MVAVAVMGSMLMGLSAAGFAAVSYLDARERDAVRNAQGFLKVASVERELRAHKLAKRLAGTKGKHVASILMKMSMADLLRLEKMTDEGVGPLALEKFLVAALPSIELAKRLTDTIVGVAAGTPIAVSPVVKKSVDETTALVAATRKRVRAETKAKEEAAEEETQASSEPSDQPPPDDEPTNDDRNPPPDEDDGPKLPPNGPFDEQSSDKDGEGGLLE
jgi:hypothetical protein